MQDFTKGKSRDGGIYFRVSESIIYLVPIQTTIRCWWIARLSMLLSQGKVQLEWKRLGLYILSLKSW